MPGLVIIAGSSTLCDFVVQTLSRAFPDAKVIIQQGEPRVLNLKKRIRRHGLIKALGQVGFRALLVRMVKNKRDRIDDIWTTSNLGTKSPRDIAPETVADLNSAQMRAILSETHPDVVFVFGVRKISAATLESTHAPFVNLHLGITPRYRGVYTGYWALVNRDQNSFGATVHLVDHGLDTGAILKQITCRPSANDTIATYNHVLAAASLPVVTDVLSQILSGKPIETHDPGEPKPLFFEPTLWQYIVGRLGKEVA